MPGRPLPIQIPFFTISSSSLNILFTSPGDFCIMNNPLNENTAPVSSILIVDDESDVLEFLSYQFRQRGYKVFTTADPEYAIHIAEEEHPEFIITDILMDHVSGIELTRRIKKNEAIKNIPVLVISSTSDDYLILGAMEAGADHFISKPLLVEEIEEFIFSRKKEDSEKMKHE